MVQSIAKDKVKLKWQQAKERCKQLQIAPLGDGRKGASWIAALEQYEAEEDLLMHDAEE